MNNIPVAGIGASAGGLEAFEQFFRNVPADTGMAFVLVSHLDPNHASLLTEILQRSTTLPIIEADDQIAVAPNHVYVIPPNRDMTILQGKLQLNIPDEPHGQRMPIDTFLRSLAIDKGDKAIGIILSGTGTDGTLGLKAILDAGGVSFVQEPVSAKYDGMPSSAIRAGYARFVLSADKIAKALASETHAAVTSQETPPTPAAISGMNRILMQLRTATGHDFTLYKKSTINRRIEHRMSQHNIDDTYHYVRYLKENPNEAHTLFKELLINVTGFFRDAEAFDTLKRDILPDLFRDKPEDYAFRVWVAGCASGEEAYSIAILLYEWLEETHQTFNVQIFATDLDEDVIAFARTGVYPLTVVQGITTERLHRFFIKEDAGYRINKEIRKKVMFALHNVISDPPFTKIDLLSCRNLMIYLEPELQQRLISTFHYALRPEGVLFLSPAESIGTHTELFSPLNRKWKFYRAIHTMSFSRAVMTNPSIWASDNIGKAPEVRIKKSEDSSFAELTQRALLQFYAPASVLTDVKGNILFVFGETGKYLRPAPGQPTLNVIEMAREGLPLELRAALNAAAQGTPTLGRELPVKTNGGFTTVSLSVRVLPDLISNEAVLLLSFQDVTTPSTSLRKQRRKHTTTSGQGRIEELERDLDYTRENLQATIEEQQASNEELQSVNEELQSSNEELSTSKEELQSVNEELITVNAELQAKIEQLIGIQNDMKNLFDNVNVGSIFLDEHLLIRRFTRDAAKIYRLVATDVGRPLSDIKAVIEDQDLLTEAQTVLDTLIPYEREVHITNGGWYLGRIHPYRTLDNVIEGVVLNFTDISTRREAEMAMQDARELAESIINTVREPLIVLEGGLKVVSVSRTFYSKFQVAPGETLGRTIYELGNGQWDIASLRTLLESILQRDQTFDDYVVEHDFPSIGYRKMLLNARRITTQIGNKPLILLAIEDVT